jgi:hypothetical protein
MERVFMKSDRDLIKKLKKYAVLTKDGIQLPNGEIITDSRIVEIARKCERFLEAGDERGFLLFVYGPNYYTDDNEMVGGAFDDLSKDETSFLLFCTLISPGKYYIYPTHRRLIDIMDTFEDDRLCAINDKHKLMNSNNMAKIFIDGDIKYGYANLTKDGILFPNGKVVTEGKLYDVVRECERLSEKDDREEFYTYLFGKNRDPNIKEFGEALKDLSKEELNLLIFGIRFFFENKFYIGRLFDILKYKDRRRS